MEHNLECAHDFIHLMKPLVPTKNVCIRFVGTARRRAERNFMRSILVLAKQCEAHRQTGSVILDIAFENGGIEQYSSQMLIRVSDITKAQLLRRVFVIMSLIIVTSILTILILGRMRTEAVRLPSAGFLNLQKRHGVRSDLTTLGFPFPIV